MDIDDVFARIGDFGSAQKKIFYILSTCQTFLGLHALILSFIGPEPVWECVGNGGQIMDCPAYERGKCYPVYIDEFYTIVSEVNLCIQNHT